MQENICNGDPIIVSFVLQEQLLVQICIHAILVMPANLLELALVAAKPVIVDLSVCKVNQLVKPAWLVAMHQKIKQVV